MTAVVIIRRPYAHPQALFSSLQGNQASTSYNRPLARFSATTTTAFTIAAAVSRILFAICFRLAMLSTQVLNHSVLGLTMATVAGPQLFSGAPSSITAAADVSVNLDIKKKPPCKRKRTGDTASDSAESSSQPARTRDGPKKKKANRACFHCQKAHLTCDDCECSRASPSPFTPLHCSSVA
jgi:hypothetical protein